nr:MAG TPA: hypothetical protein [Caudoviricetes sp.]
MFYDNHAIKNILLRIVKQMEANLNGNNIQK